MEIIQNQLKIAIVVNKNARRVDEREIEKIQQVVNSKGLNSGVFIYISDSLKDLKEIAKTIVYSKFDVVFCVGGDGTFSAVVSSVMNLKPEKLPAFGTLKCGTGNSIAKALGSKNCRYGFDAEIQQAYDNNARVKQLMLRVDDLWSPFMGIGLDAYVLRDYAWARETLNRSFIPEKFRGGIDYAFGIATVTFWRYLLARNMKVEIINGSDDAYKIDDHGRRTGDRIKPGELLYKGPITFCAASTIRFYGWEICAFPQAHVLKDRFQLRFTDLGIISLLSLVGDILFRRREVFHDRIWDYACKEIKIKLLGDVPMQVGGDLIRADKEIIVSVDSIIAVQGSVAASPPPENNNGE